MGKATNIADNDTIFQFIKGKSSSLDEYVLGSGVYIVNIY